MTPRRSKKQSMTTRMDGLQEYLLRLSEDGFYGQVVLFFQNGSIDTVKTESVLKVDELVAAATRKRVLLPQVNAHE